MLLRYQIYCDEIPMYLDYYGLKQKPFTLQPDPDFLLLTKRHRFAFEAMQYSIMNSAPTVVVTGEIGTGKTTLVRHYLNNTKSDTTIGLISNTHENFSSLHKWILSCFDLDYTDLDPIQCYDKFVYYLITEYSASRRVVLIIDEAQNLSHSQLEELRLLTNINSEKDQLLQLILVGQPQLRAKLMQPEMVQFAQRISLHYHLKPLLSDEVNIYIRHRLRIAGGPISIFDTDAIGKISDYSKGVPRVINSICEMSLIYGFTNGQKKINRNIINDVISDNVNNSIYFSKSTNSNNRESNQSKCFNY